MRDIADFQVTPSLVDTVVGLPTSEGIDAQTSMICAEYLAETQLANVKTMGAAVVVVILNFVLRTFSKFVVSVEKLHFAKHYVEEWQRRLFLHLFFSSIVLVLLVSFDFDKSLDFLPGNDGTITGFGSGGYSDSNPSFVASVVSIFPFIVFFSLVFELIVDPLRREVAFKMAKKYLKKRAFTEEALQHVYAHFKCNWLLQVRIANLTVIMVVALMFSSAAPILLYLAFAYVVGCYFLDKFLLMHRKSVTDSDGKYHALVAQAYRRLPFAYFMHFVFATQMFGNQLLFPSGWDARAREAMLSAYVNNESWFRFFLGEDFTDKYVKPLTVERYNEVLDNGFYYGMAGGDVSSAEEKSRNIIDYFRARFLDSTARSASSPMFQIACYMFLYMVIRQVIWPMFKLIVDSIRLIYFIDQPFARDSGKAVEKTLRRAFREIENDSFDFPEDDELEKHESHGFFDRILHPVKEFFKKHHAHISNRISGKFAKAPNSEFLARGTQVTYVDARSQMKRRHRPHSFALTEQKRLGYVNVFLSEAEQDIARGNFTVSLKKWKRADNIMRAKALERDTLKEELGHRDAHSGDPGKIAEKRRRFARLNMELSDPNFIATILDKPLERKTNVVWKIENGLIRRLPVTEQVDTTVLKVPQEWKEAKQKFIDESKAKGRSGVLTATQEAALLDKMYADRDNLEQLRLDEDSAYSEDEKLIETVTKKQIWEADDGSVYSVSSDAGTVRTLSSLASSLGKSSDEEGERERRNNNNDNSNPWFGKGNNKDRTDSSSSDEDYDDSNVDSDY